MRRQAKLGHAWLLSGRPGIGKQEFARCFAQLALCETPDAALAACGHCRSCHLYAAGNHPDLRVLTPAEDANSIGIDQVRELGDFFALTAHYGKAKVALLRPVDVMTRGAANALLKLLEEPPALGLFILVTDHLERLPATVRSRCQRLALDTIDTDRALAWLRAQAPEVSVPDLRRALSLSQLAPLGAVASLAAGDLALASRIEAQMAGVASGRVHAVQAAQAIGDVAAAKLADLMLGYAHQLALQPLGAAASPGADQVGLNSLADQLNSRQICEFVTAALEVKGQAVPTANFRQGDLVDILWQAWMKATRGTSRRISQSA
jgi:DNA polymerase-3 subunit delta'